jgi:uncharacterized membrane protein YdjX (TVP38/TMEM64 family)
MAVHHVGSNVLAGGSDVLAAGLVAHAGRPGVWSVVPSGRCWPPESLAAGDLPDAGGAEWAVFAGVELDEVAGRQRRATPPAGELPLAPDHVALEADERSRARADDSLLAVDDAAQLRRVEYLPGDCRVRGDCLDAVDCLREREFGVLEMCQQCHAHLDCPGNVAGGVDSASRTRVVVAGGPGGAGTVRRAVLGCVVTAGPGDVVESDLFVLVVGHVRGRWVATTKGLPPGIHRSHMHPATRRQAVAVAGLLAVAALSTLAVSPAAVLARLEGLAGAPLVLAGVLVAVYLVRPFLLWPMSLVAVVLGYLYGPVGIPIALVGALLTATPPYLLGRYAQTDIGLFGTVSNSGRRLVGAVGETRGVLAARLSPVPGDPISYCAGMSDVSARPFYLGTLVGEVPWAVVAVLTGASMRSLSLAEFAVSPELVVVLAGLAVLTLSGPLYSHTQTSQAG